MRRESVSEAMSKQWILVGVVVAGLAAGATALAWFGPDIKLVEVGARAPDFRAIDLATGDSVSFREHYEGAVTLVNIWATWCLPCRVEMPGMDSVYQSLAPRGFKIAAVSIDEGSPEDVRGFARDLGLSFDLLQDRSGNVQQIYQTTGVPESFLINQRRDHREAPHRRACLELTGEPQVDRAHCWTRPVAEWILGIETSCDETSAAVVRAENGRSALASLTILSQDVHRIFGGVVPELASRAHVHAIGSVVERALADAGNRIASAGWSGGDRRARAGRRAARRGDVWEDPGVQRRPSTHRGQPSRGSSLCPHPGGPDRRAAVHRAAGERRPHHAAGCPRLG